MQAGTQGKRKTEWECSWAADALGLGIRCPRPLYSRTMPHLGPHQGDGMVDLTVRQKDANDTYMKNYLMAAFFMWGNLYACPQLLALVPGCRACESMLPARDAELQSMHRS